MLAIIQCRTSSKRFPGKALFKIKSIPLILRVYTQVKKSRLIKDILVATSKNKSDNKLAKFLKKKNIKVYRGSLKNVADRLLKASQKYKYNHFMRISGDSPLIEPKIIDKAIKIFRKKKKYDIITNVFPRTFPKGQSVEIISNKIISDNIFKMNTIHKEHVTKFFYENKNKFLIKNFSSKKKIKINQTIDYKSDIKKLNFFFKYKI